MNLSPFYLFVIAFLASFHVPFFFFGLFTVFTLRRLHHGLKPKERKEKKRYGDPLNFFFFAKRLQGMLPGLQACEL